MTCPVSLGATRMFTSSTPTRTRGSAVGDGVDSGVELTGPLLGLPESVAGVGGLVAGVTGGVAGPLPCVLVVCGPIAEAGEGVKIVAEAVASSCDAIAG